MGGGRGGFRFVINAVYGENYYIAAVLVSAHLLNVRAIGAPVKKIPVSCLKKLDQCQKMGKR